MSGRGRSIWQSVPSVPPLPRRKQRSGERRRVINVHGRVLIEDEIDGRAPVAGRLVQLVGVNIAMSGAGATSDRHEQGGGKQRLCIRSEARQCALVAHRLLLQKLLLLLLLLLLHPLLMLLLLVLELRSDSSVRHASGVGLHLHVELNGLMCLHLRLGLHLGMRPRLLLLLLLL